MARTWNPAYHPRGKGGRFTRSSTRVMTQADRNRGSKAMDGFKPTQFTDAGSARDYLERTTTGKPDGAAARYLDEDWRDVNTALRAGKTVDGVDEIDQQMRPLPDDLMLRRQVPLSLFAHVPMKDLEGMKVRDAAYASTSLDVPGHEPSAAGVVTMHMAAPKGTPALVNADDGEILLARDTEVAITRVEPDGRGGWDVYGTVLPKAKKRTKAAPAASEPGPAGSKPDAAPKSSPDRSRSAPKPAPPAPGPASPAAVDDRIPAIIGGIIARDAGRRSDLVSLARVRDELTDLDRADVDAALLRLDRARVIQLDPDPNRKALSDRAKAAAIPLGGEDMHLVSLIDTSGTASSDDGLELPAAKQGNALDAVPIDATASPRPAALTHRMFRALSGYRAEGFTAVNGQLRGGADTPAVTRQIAAMDEALQASQLTGDVQVFRGLADARSMFGDRVDADLTGMQWREDAFVSTTSERKVARRFAEDGLSGGTPMVMHVTVPQGTSALVLSRIESEMLVDRGHTLRVVRDLGVVDDMRVVEVEVEPKTAEATS